MKKNNKKSGYTLWEAFIEFMENLYWPGCPENFTPENLRFEWNAFVADHSPV